MREESKQWSAETRLQVAALVVAIVAGLATVYFSLRAERNKELTISVVSKRPLLIVEPTRPTDGLEVRVRGESVVSPWLVSLRVENTGSLAIEERDIESPLKVVFQGGKSINAELQAISQPALTASLERSGDSLTVHHKLLNPGDWLAIDVLFDGEPKVPPVALARISGVSEPRMLEPRSAVAKSAVTFVPMPAPAILVILVVTSLLTVGLMLTSAALGLDALKHLLTMARSRRSSPTSGDLSDLPFELQLAVKEARPHSVEARAIYGVISADAAAFLSNESWIANRVSGLPPGFLSALGHDVQSAVALLKSELRDALKEALARQLQLHLPQGKDIIAHDKMLQFDAAQLTTSELIECARELFEEFGRPYVRGQAHKGALAGAAVLFMIGLALLMLVGGSWRLFLER